MPFDAPLLTWLHAGPDDWPGWLWLARAASQGLPVCMLGLLALAAALGPATVRRAACTAACAMALAWLAARGMQAAWPQARPFADGVVTAWMEHAATPSFPSTHATVAGAYAAALLHMLRPRGWGLAACAGALAIAWSRVALGLHYPGDVLAGLLLGAACAMPVARWAGAARAQTPPRALAQGGLPGTRA